MGSQPTVNPSLATSTAIISAPLAVMACAAMAVSYVAILYAPSFLLRLPPPTSLESYMLRRFACAAVSSASSVVLTASLFGIGRFTDMASLLGVYGVKFNHYMWRAVVFPLLLTSLVYAGSIVSKILLMISYRRRVGLTCSWNFKEQIHALVFNVMAWRNYVVAPFTEELVFRACMIPLLLCGGFKTYKIIFVSPVFFSLAHLNHFLELYYQQKYPFLKAFLIVGLQLGYTVIFGWYAAFLFIRTGNLISPIVAHIFCNIMGLPVFSFSGYFLNPHYQYSKKARNDNEVITGFRHVVDRVEQDMLVRIQIKKEAEQWRMKQGVFGYNDSKTALQHSLPGVVNIALAAGTVCFFWFLFPASSPDLYNDNLDGCLCWHGYCNWS